MSDEDIEMMDLSWMTKWSIRRQARRDVKNNAISRVVLVENDVYAGMSDQPTTFSSPYISEQFGKYSYYKETQLFPKQHRYWLYNDSSEQVHKRDSLPATVADILAQISLRKMKLGMFAEQQQVEMNNLELDQRKYELSREFHMVQMCVNQAMKLREDFNKRTLPERAAIHALYSQLVLILETDKTASVKERSKRYRYIRYYCDCACRLYPELGPEYIKDEIMAMMGDTDPLGEYTVVLEDAIRQRDYYQAQLDEANDGGL